MKGRGKIVTNRSGRGMVNLTQFIVVIIIYFTTLNKLYNIIII